MFLSLKILLNLEMLTPVFTVIVPCPSFPHKSLFSHGILSLFLSPLLTKKPVILD